MDMARFEMQQADLAPLAPRGIADGDTLYRLGMRQAATAATPDERVAAHKWLNLAALRGSADAARLRREIAAEMSPAEIATAQRAARAWLTRH
jgi:hypothetical protein